MDGTHVDDAASTRLVHVGQACPCREERAVQMNRHHSFPVCEGEVHHGLHDLDAGIADQDIDPVILGRRQPPYLQTLHPPHPISIL